MCRGEFNHFPLLMESVNCSLVYKLWWPMQSISAPISKDEVIIVPAATSDIHATEMFFCFTDTHSWKGGLYLLLQWWHETTCVFCSQWELTLNSIQLRSECVRWLVLVVCGSHSFGEPLFHFHSYKWVWDFLLSYTMKLVEMCAICVGAVAFN